MASRQLIAWVALCAVATPAVPRRGMRPFAYLATDSSGRYYARCTPGAPGTTRIFRVRSSKDELVDEYRWYERSRHPNRLHLLDVGYDAGRDKATIAVFRPHNERDPRGPDKQAEFSIYLAGKLVRSYTTKELKDLGAKVETNAGRGRVPKGDYADYRFNGYDVYHVDKHPCGCFSWTIGGKIVLVDIATGKLLKNPYPRATGKPRGSPAKERKADAPRR